MKAPLITTILMLQSTTTHTTKHDVSHMVWPARTCLLQHAVTVTLTYPPPQCLGTVGVKVVEMLHVCAIRRGGAGGLGPEWQVLMRPQRLPPVSLQPVTLQGQGTFAQDHVQAWIDTLYIGLLNLVVENYTLMTRGLSDVLFKVCYSVKDIGNFSILGHLICPWQDTWQ